MAVYSMTGYATAQYGGPSDEAGHEQTPALGMEIRSVNSRFLDLAFKMSDELRGTEPALANCSGPASSGARWRSAPGSKGGRKAVCAHPPPPSCSAWSVCRTASAAWHPKAAPLSVAEILQLTSRQQALPSGLHDKLITLAQTVLTASWARANAKASGWRPCCWTA
jgi:hypothetical protein